ncbi:head maturation protease, ClpP-related [Holdemanella biformis]|uniref:head maturation protease, ClpP-related n=1 Tax=Holdemanella biformis TaxID=1735 RepID=UPI0022E54D01|nr:head maturation protease, ClpP-related [Holdemanella biformis]
MPKMKVMQMRMQVNEAKPNEADLELYDEIGESTDWWTGKTSGISAESITQFLKENQDVDTVNLHINSNGGLVFEGITIHNILKGSDKTVNVIIDGLAASIASVIAMCGDTVKMYPTSQMMIHNCWTYGCGNANDFRKLADQMDKIMDSSRIAYLSKAKDKLTEEKLNELLDNESYLTAQECFDLGLCDEIIGVDTSKKEEGKADKEKDDEPFEKSPTVEPFDKENGWFF